MGSLEEMIFPLGIKVNTQWKVAALQWLSKVSAHFGSQRTIPSLPSLVKVLVLLPASASKQLLIGTVQPGSAIRDRHDTRLASTDWFSDVLLPEPGVTQESPIETMITDIHLLSIYPRSGI